MRHCPSPTSVPMPGAVRVASMATRSITTTSQSNTAKRPPWRGTSRPDCTRCNCSTKSLCNRCNVVIIAKTNLRTQARAHVVLFSSDLDLAYAPLVDYYGLRFQIEFNFRDAKQYWGLEDFMNVTPTG